LNHMVLAKDQSLSSTVCRGHSSNLTVCHLLSYDIDPKEIYITVTPGVTFTHWNGYESLLIH
jgi:hypothetical protein